MRKKFLRRIWNRHSKLGKGRKKKQIWRRPSGRDNKMRERRRGYASRVEVGYKKSGRRNLILVKTLEDIEGIEKKDIVIMGNIGKKKKIEIVKRAKENKIKFKNLNVKQFLKKLEREKKEKEAKKKKDDKKTKKEKKVVESKPQQETPDNPPATKEEPKEDKK